MNVKVTSVQFSSLQFSPVQFSSVAQSYLTLCDPMNRSTPGLPVHHQLPEFTQTHFESSSLGPLGMSMEFSRPEHWRR